MQRNHRSNCQYPLDYQKSGRVPEKHLLLLIDYAKAFDCVDHCKLWEILQARIQQYVNRELPDVQAGFRKGRGTRDQIASIRWIMEKARVLEKHLLLLY